MSFDSKSPASSTESPTAESDVRRALGLGAQGHGQRRRFTQDRDVQVTVLRSRRERSRDDSEAALQIERVARRGAEEALASAQKMIRDLHTKLAHLELAQDELRAALGRARQEQEVLDAAVTEHQRAHKTVEERLARKVGVRKAAGQKCNAQPREPTPAAASEPSCPPLAIAPSSSAANDHDRLRKPRMFGRRFIKEQEPVDWWSKHEKK